MKALLKTRYRALLSSCRRKIYANQWAYTILCFIILEKIWKYRSEIFNSLKYLWETYWIYYIAIRVCVSVIRYEGYHSSKCVSEPQRRLSRRLFRHILARYETINLRVKNLMYWKRSFGLFWICTAVFPLFAYLTQLMMEKRHPLLSICV